MNNSLLRDTRLFDALEYVDERFIAEVTDKYEPIGGPGQPNMPKRVRRIFYAKLAAAVACIMLLSGLVGRLPEVLHEISISRPGERPDDVWISEEEFLEKYFYPQKGERYLGRYGDCYAMCVPDSFNAIGDPVIVAGFSFPNTQYNPIWVYYEDQYFRLQDAFDMGLVTEDDVAVLHDRWSTLWWFTASKESAPIKLPILQMRRIIYDKIKDLRYSPDFDRRFIYELQCYYASDDIYIVAVNCETDGSTITESIAGYKFQYNAGAPIEVYKEGSFYSLEDAYEQGIISRSIIRKAYKNYENHN